MRTLTYVRGFLAGLAAVICAPLAFECVLIVAALVRFGPAYPFMVDGRWMVGKYWFLAAPAAMLAFLLGFVRQLRRRRRTTN